MSPTCLTGVGVINSQNQSHSPGDTAKPRRFLFSFDFYRGDRCTSSLGKSGNFNFTRISLTDIEDRKESKELTKHVKDLFSFRGAPISSNIFTFTKRSNI